MVSLLILLKVLISLFIGAMAVSFSLALLISIGILVVSWKHWHTRAQ